MIGTYLQDLYQELTDPKFVADLNVLLSDLGLKEISGIEDLQGKTRAKPTPYILLDLSKERNMRIGSQDYQVVEDVPLTLSVHVIGSQRDILTYEGVVKTYLKGKEAELRDKITDCQLVVLHVARSNMERNASVTNAEAWVINITFRLVFNWE